MGLFDRFKRKEQTVEAAERLENFPELLNAKLLFFEKPILDIDKILDELKVWMADAPQHDDLTFILMRVA